jgi:hypothetical protein
MKRYEKKFQESFFISNKDSALQAISQGIEYIYSLYGDDLKADKLVAIGVYEALRKNDDAKSSMLMINKYIRELANR